MAAHPSALSEALVRIGDRWSLQLVEALLDGPQRFADLEEAVAGISTNVLAARLRHLEGTGIVLAVPYSRRPVRYAYELTETGRGLAGAVRLLSQWSANLGGHPAPGRTPVHQLCGTPMEAVWWCPTCEQAAGGDGEAVWV